MRGKTAVGMKRTVTSPKFSERLALTFSSKVRRSLIPQKSRTDVLELSRPLTAKEHTLVVTVDRPSAAAAMSGRKTMTEAMRSLSPTPRNYKVQAKVIAGDKMRGRLENYAIGRQLGQGAYAIVHLGTHKVTKDKVAIKTYEKSKLTDAHKKLGVKREIAILEKLSHEHTVSLVEAIDARDKVSIVMEYVNGLSLHGYLKQRANRRLDPVEARRLFKQIVSAVQYCHSLHIAHRDLKLENILLNEDTNVKLIDFGFSTCFPGEKRTATFCGTPSYMAPEIVGRREYLGSQADMWALGVLLYTMLCGGFPFKGANDAELYRKIQKGLFTVPEFIEEGPRRLIRKLLHFDPSKRPTAEDVLRDEWLEHGINPQPSDSQPADISTHETDQFDSSSLGRLGSSGNTTTLVQHVLVKPASAALHGRVARQLTMSSAKLESLMARIRPSSQGRLAK